MADLLLTRSRLRALLSVLAVTAAALVAASAHAAAQDAPAPSWGDLVAPLIEFVLVPVLIVIGSALALRIRSWIATLDVTERQRAAIQQLDAIVEDVVLATFQTTVASLKREAGAGGLDATAAHRIKSDAMAAVRRKLSQDTLEQLGRAFGEGLDSVLDTKIEAAVARAKAAQPLRGEPIKLEAK